MSLSPYNGFSPEQRERAAAWIRSMIAAGRLERPRECACCGQTAGAIHYHAEDYSEPFGQQTVRYPLCWTCHLAWHCRFRERVGVLQYIGHVAAGLRPTPVRGFPQLTALLKSPAPFPGVAGAHRIGMRPWHMMNTEAGIITGRAFAL